MHHPLSLRVLANLTITILLASNLVSAFYVEDLLHTLRSLKDAPAGSVALNARNSNLTAPASAPVSNDTVRSSHPDSSDEKKGGLGLGDLLHSIFGRHDTPSTSVTFKARNLTITPAAVVSNNTIPSGSPHLDAAPHEGHGLGLSGLFHKIFSRHDSSITITLNIRASNDTVTPAGVSNGTIPGGASHPDAATKGDHGSLGLGDLLHKIFNRHNTPTVPGPLAGRSSNSTVLPAAISNGTVPTGSSHPDAASDKGQGLGLGGLLNKIFGRSELVPVSVEPEDVDEVDGEVGMLMSLNRRAKKDGEKRLSREERRKNREKSRVRRAMSAATEAKKEERHVARSRIFRG